MTSTLNDVSFYFLYISFYETWLLLGGGRWFTKLLSQMLVAIFRPKYLHPLAVKNDGSREIKINTFPTI